MLLNPHVGGCYGSSGVRPDVWWGVELLKPRELICGQILYHLFFLLFIYLLPEEKTRLGVGALVSESHPQTQQAEMVRIELSLVTTLYDHMLLIFY